MSVCVPRRSEPVTPTAQLKNGSIWRHLKRDTLFQVQAVAKGEGAGIEGALLVVYHDLDDRQTYVRAVSEFLDGRFVLHDLRTATPGFKNRIATTPIPAVSTVPIQLPVPEL